MKRLDQLITGLATLVSWACLAMVLLQVTAVLLRYVFSIGAIGLQEAVVYCHALIFLLAAAGVLQLNEHVRVDIFYGSARGRVRRTIDIIGLLLFALPMALTILYFSWPYVLRAWSSLEGSRQAGGLPAIYLLKSCILIFGASVALQALSLVWQMMSGRTPKAWQAQFAAEN